MKIEEKVIFWKVSGTLYAIYNNTTKDDKILHYLISGLIHGVEPVIDEVLNRDSFSLSSEVYNDMLKMLYEKKSRY